MGRKIIIEFDIPDGSHVTSRDLLGAMGDEIGPGPEDVRATVIREDREPRDAGAQNGRHDQPVIVSGVRPVTVGPGDSVVFVLGGGGRGICGSTASGA